MVAIWIKSRVKRCFLFFFLSNIRETRNMFKYWWERGSRENQLKIQERRDHYWNEVLKAGVMVSETRGGWRQGWD